MATGMAGLAVSRSRSAPAPAVVMVPDYREAVVAPHRPLTLDPLLGRADAASRDLGHLTHRALLTLDTRVQPAPDLVASWGVSGDGLVYRMQLADGGRWSDGTPVVAADVVATVALVQRPDFPDAALAATVKGVVVTSDAPGVVTLSLGAPRASFATALADLPILPAAVAGRPTAVLIATAHQPVPGSGPFRVTSSDASTVELAASPTSSRRPLLRTMELRLEPDFPAAAQALVAGQVDAVEATTPAERTALVAVRGVSLHDTVSLSFVDLLFNTRHPGLADQTVRRAIATAVDRGSLIRSALGGDARPQTDAIPAGITWIAGSAVEQPQPALASRALDAAGWAPERTTGVRHKAGVALSFDLAVPDVAPLPAVATQIVSQLGAIGIAVRVTTVAESRFLADVVGTRAFDMAVAEWDNGPDPDVSVFWRSNATPPGGFNASGLAADPFLDRALDSLATEIDPQLRADAAQRVDQRVAEVVPAVFLYAPQTTFASGPALRAVTVPAAGTTASRYDDMDGWTSGRGA